MEKTIFFVVEDDTQSRDNLRRELEQRYAADYQVICEASPGQAIDRLAELQSSAAVVALLLADCWMPEMSGADFLVRAHQFFPHAKRGLLLDWGDPSCSAIITDGMGFNKIDAYAPKPAIAASFPNEEFHHFIGDLLAEWSLENRPVLEVFRIVGKHWDRRSYELRDLLSRNSIQYTFWDVDSAEGRAFLEQTGAVGAPLPVVVRFDGRVFTNPSNADLAEAVGAKTAYDPAGTRQSPPVDVMIVGAGPAGLSAAVNGASEGLNTVMVEREAHGGQASMSSRIRNYLGFPAGISGVELAHRAYHQAQLFGVETIFTQSVTGLAARGDERVTTLTDGSEIVSRTVLLAMGVAYRKLEIPSLEHLMGAGIFYGAVGSEAVALRGQDVVIVGGANSAGQAAVHLARYARQVTMLVRGPSLSASMSEYLIRVIEARANIRVLCRTRVVDGLGDGRLAGVVVQNGEAGKPETLPAAALFVMIGATPHTAWLPPQVLRDRAGYILTGTDLIQNGALPAEWPLKRLPFALETSLPGVFAVGDVRHRSVKRVASAVGEGSMGIQYVHQYLAELEKKRVLEG